MRHWFELGYFSLRVPVKYAEDPGPYTSIGKLFDPPHVAFLGEPIESLENAAGALRGEAQVFPPNTTESAAAAPPM